MGRGKRSRKNKKGKGGGGGDDLKTEQRLQAILLADSFTETFRPITREQPKVGQVACDSLWAGSLSLSVDTI